MLPIGEGLFAFNDMSDILAAIDAIRGDYDRHSNAARDIAKQYFSADVVLSDVLRRLGL